MAYNAELLSNFKKEKKSLEQRISELTRISDERKAEVERLKIELSNARMSSTLTGVAAEEMQLIRSQNEILKEQLRENGISVEHFTDMEKLRLLEQIHGENNRSAAETNLGDRRASLHARSEASERVDLEQDIRLSYEDLTSIARRYAISSDHSLDRHSSLSVDRGLNAVSIADLKDRFLQMQETHYSTNEELQATLQELGDLQENLNEMTSENEKLAEDKAILFESLNSQTVKLEHARLQVEHLKALLIRDSEYEDRSENESQLVALVKSAEEEKEELLLKQAEFQKSLISFEMENRELQDIISALRDKTTLEETKNSELSAKIKNLEEQLQATKDFKSNDGQKGKRNESEDMSCESFENKISSLEFEKSEVSDELQRVKQELYEAQDEVLKLREHISNMNDDLKESSTKSLSQIEEFKLLLEQKDNKISQSLEMNNTLEDRIWEIQLQCDRASKENDLLTAKIQKLDSKLKTAAKQQEDLNDELQGALKQFQEEQEEWLQFQQDLQIAVVVANDIIAEKQEMLDALVTENASLKSAKDQSVVKNEKERLYPIEIGESPTISSEIQSKIISNVDRDLALLRQGRISNSEMKSGLQPLLQQMWKLINQINPFLLPSQVRTWGSRYFNRTVLTRSIQWKIIQMQKPSIPIMKTWNQVEMKSSILRRNLSREFSWTDNWGN